jgi:DNA primase
MAEPTPEDLELDFSRESTKKIYGTSAFKGISPLRWTRIHTEIEIEDVISELTGLTPDSADKISCPFHGRDSTPSFTIYRRGNDATCYGCSAGDQYYNADRFVAKYLGISRIKALIWLERRWKLPPIDDVTLEGYEDEDETAIPVQLSFKDIVPAFLRRAEIDVQEYQDHELFFEYHDIYFEALGLMHKAEEARKTHDDPEEGAHEAKELEAKAALTLARVVGKKTLERLIRLK